MYTFIASNVPESIAITLPEPLITKISKRWCITNENSYGVKPHLHYSYQRENWHACKVTLP